MAMVDNLARVLPGDDNYGVSTPTFGRSRDVVGQAAELRQAKLQARRPNPLPRFLPEQAQSSAASSFSANQQQARILEFASRQPLPAMIGQQDDDEELQLDDELNQQAQTMQARQSDRAVQGEQQARKVSRAKQLANKQLEQQMEKIKEKGLEWTRSAIANVTGRGVAAADTSAGFLDGAISFAWSCLVLAWECSVTVFPQLGTATKKLSSPAGLASAAGAQPPKSMPSMGIGDLLPDGFSFKRPVTAAGGIAQLLLIAAAVLILSFVILFMIFTVLAVCQQHIVCSMVFL